MFVRFATYPIIAIFVLMQGVCAWHYWGAFETGAAWRLPLGIGMFQTIGVTLVAVEVLALVLFETMTAARARAKARFWLVAFCVVFTVNLVADAGAVSSFFADDQAARQEAARTSELRRSQSETDRNDARRDAQQARARLLGLGFEQPIEELRVLLGAQQENERRWRARYGERMLLPRAYVDQRHRLEQAIAAAAAFDAARRTETQATARLAALPDDSDEPALHAGIAAQVRLLRMTGIELETDDWTAVLALVLAAICKVLGAFGIWATTIVTNPAAIDAHSTDRKTPRRRFMSAGLPLVGLIGGALAFSANASPVAPENSRQPSHDAAITAGAWPVARATGHAPDLTNTPVSHERRRPPSAKRSEGVADAVARRKPRYDPAVVVRAIDAYRHGARAHEIATELGCHRSQVFRWLDRAGAPTHRARERRP